MVAGACAMSMLIPACSSSKAPAPSVGATSSVVGGSSGVPPHKNTVEATFSDNGHTVELTIGQRLHVALPSTFWDFATPTGAALRVDVAPSPHSAASCIPGGGCGTTATTYVAVGRGSVDVTAHRGICGEAMGCTAKTGAFVLHVVVR